VVLLLSAGWAGVATGADEESGAEPEPQRRRLPVARVTALRTAELPEDPSSFSSVIEVQEVQGEDKTVDDLLAQQVGVQVRRFGGPGQASEISIRGSTGQQVVVLLDGVRLNTAQSGTVDLSTIPLAFVERIEVARGGGGAWVGSGAIGGVVNIVTRRPEAEARSSASLRGGSFGTWEGSLSHADRAGPFDYGLAYSGFRTEGDWKFQSIEIQTGTSDPVPSQELERINNDSESHALVAQAGLVLAPGARLRATDQVFFVSRGQPGPDTNPNAPNGGQNRDAHERRLRNVADLRLEIDELPRIAEGLSVETGLSWLHERTHFRDPSPDLGEPIDVVQKNRSIGWRSRAELERDVFGVGQLATLAVDVRYDSLSSEPESASFRNPDAFHRRWNAAVGLRDELDLFGGSLTLLPGVRYDYSEGEGGEWIPRLGAIVSPTAWLRIKANGERAYRVPNFDELFFPDKGFIRGNPNLKPEKAWSADVGVELGLAELGPLENLNLQAALFYQDIQNQIVWQRISPFTVAPTNSNDAEVRGLELAGSLELFGWIGFSGNWTLQDADLDRPQLPSVPGGPPPIQQPGSALPGRAESEYQLRLALGPSSRLFRLVGERSHTSKIHVNSSESATLSGRTVYDASASLDLAQLWRPRARWFPRQLVASVTASNLTDRSVRDSVGFPQPGRTLSFGIEGQW
jgi:iron complex outermembrane receptor protein